MTNLDLDDPRLVAANTPSVLEAYWKNPLRRYGASSPTHLDYISPSWSGRVYGWIVDTDQDTFKEIVIARMRGSRQSHVSAEELSEQIHISFVDPAEALYLWYVSDLPEKARKYLKDTGQSWRGNQFYWKGGPDKFYEWWSNRKGDA